MSELEFLSLDRIDAGGGFEPVWRSPLQRGLADAPDGVRDISRTGKLEVRGDGAAVDEDDVVRISPQRTLVLCPESETPEVRARLRARSDDVVDVTAALAGISVTGEPLMRRLTDLDLGALPAAGAFARVQAIVLRTGGEFRIFFPQEYGQYVAEVVVDAARGVS